MILRFLVIIALLQITFAAIAQEEKFYISGDYDQLSFPDFVNDVENQIPVRFMYHFDMVDEITVSGNFNKMAIEDVLKRVFNNTNCNFLYADNKIIVTENISIQTKLPIHFFERTELETGSNDELIFDFETEAQEARYIAQEIHKLLDSSNGVSPNDIGILYRSRGGINKSLKTALIAYNIPFIVPDLNKFSEKNHVAGALTFLKNIYADKITLQDAFDIFGLLPFALESNFTDTILPIFTAIENKIGDNKYGDEELIEVKTRLKDREEKDIKIFLDILDQRLQKKQFINYNLWFYYNEIFLKNKTFIQDIQTDEIDVDYQKLFEIAENIKTDFKKYLYKIKNEFIENKGVSAVTISTMHSAKGCQWHTVFLPGLIDGIFPSERRDILDNQEDNLFYVALTRTKSQLYLSYPKISNHKISQPIQHNSDT